MRFRDLLQQLPSCGDDIGDGDFEQTLFRFAMAGVIGHTAGAAQHNRSCPEGAVARRICGTKNCDHRDFQSGGQVHRSGIAADEEASPAGERDQLRNRAGDFSRRSGAGGFDGGGQFFFTRAVVYERRQSIFCELPGNLSITLGRASAWLPSPRRD